MPARAIDQCHGNDGCQQVGCSDDNRLQIGGQRTVARGTENVAQVVQDRVDARQLVEHADADREHDQLAVAAP